MEAFFCDIKTISNKMKPGIELRCAEKPLIEKSLYESAIFDGYGTGD